MADFIDWTLEKSSEGQESWKGKIEIGWWTWVEVSAWLYKGKYSWDACIGNPGEDYTLSSANHGFDDLDCVMNAVELWYKQNSVMIALAGQLYNLQSIVEKLTGKDDD